ncbi:hypothetical protein EDB81DRAFT_63987 [Dactylonectria macrodidyma]|uniref:Nephrocystin 3-like N-terminal domain-containing protein n=1 Tax=Dactylonectria macrodidyma TaxID=307937 RepID=A0A9P9EPG9_9HYPO|nr:hypothetical protein EDB81DRAFT_63987 [Dactylonectria macrodidyma]
MKELLGLVKASQILHGTPSWLNAPDIAINYNEISKKKHSGTGVWFAKGPSFTTWLTKNNSLLWLNVFAGCGKSVLCSTAIQHTFRYQRSNPSIGIASFFFFFFFFFFTFNNEGKQNTSAMLRSLVLQLSAQLSDDHAVLTRLHRSCPNGSPSEFALVDSLHKLIQSLDHVYVLLDTLDESPRDKYQRDVLQALADIRGWSLLGLRLLVTSRDEADIRDALQSQSGEDISLRNADVSLDISSYISSYLRNTSSLQRWKPFHDRIEKALVEGANGVFRWVQCQFTTLESCPSSDHRLQHLLESLPPSLGKTYERMLLNIEEDSVEDARRLLMLLCVSNEPLSVEEVIEGMPWSWEMS